MGFSDFWGFASCRLQKPPINLRWPQPLGFFWLQHWQQHQILFVWLPDWTESFSVSVPIFRSLLAARVYFCSLFVCFWGTFYLLVYVFSNGIFRQVLFRGTAVTRGEDLCYYKTLSQSGLVGVCFLCRSSHAALFALWQHLRVQIHGYPDTAWGDSVNVGRSTVRLLNFPRLNVDLRNDSSISDIHQCQVVSVNPRCVRSSWGDEAVAYQSKCCHHPVQAHPYRRQMMPAAFLLCSSNTFYSSNMCPLLHITAGV